LIAVEYRARIEVPNLPFSEEANHERLFRALLRDHGDLGPVMSWTDDGTATLVVLSADDDNRGSAVEEMVDAVRDSLRESALSHLSPTVAGVEPVDGPAATAA
jgi:hypothetical protein